MKNNFVLKRWSNQPSTCPLRLHLLIMISSCDIFVQVPHWHNCGKICDCPNRCITYNGQSIDTLLIELLLLASFPEHLHGSLGNSLTTRLCKHSHI
jgi:hypothetical protein